MKWILYFSIFSLGSGCVMNLDKGDKSGREGIGGVISSISGFIFPAAHAASTCSSSKSSNSEFYAELYEIKDVSVLGTDTESTGLEKLCDVDITSNSYFFDLKKSSLGDIPLKVKIVDTREGGTHNGKEILTSPKATDFSINKEKTIQSKLIEREFKTEGKTVANIKFDDMSTLSKKFHSDLISSIIQNNTELEEKSIEVLIKTLDVFELKVTDFYTSNPGYTNFESVPQSIKSDVTKFSVQDQIANLTENQKCFLQLNPSVESYLTDLMACEHGSSSSAVTMTDEQKNLYIQSFMNYIGQNPTVGDALASDISLLPVVFASFLEGHTEYSISDHDKTILLLALTTYLSEV